MNKLLDVLYKLVIIFLAWPLYIFVGVLGLFMAMAVMVNAIMEESVMIFCFGIGWLLAVIFWLYIRLPTFESGWRYAFGKGWLITAISAVALMCAPFIARILGKI